MPKRIVYILLLIALFTASSALAAPAPRSPAPPQFTIPARERIVIYVADG